VWGLKNAADSVLDEYNDKTWDWQRMSIIGPWKLAVGKLFGSTIYNWYITVIAFVFYIVSASSMRDSVQELKIGLFALIVMVIIHGLMIMLSLLTLRRNDGRTKIRSNRIFMIGFSIALLLYLFYQRTFRDMLGSGTIDFSWYGIVDSPIDIALLNALFYCGWVIAGLYRSMRAELQFTDKPIWWLAFMVTSFLFQFGFTYSSQTVNLPGAIALTSAGAFFQTVVMMYFLALSEPKDIVNFRLLMRSWRNRDFDTFWRNIPLWLTTLPVAFIFGLLSAIFFPVAKATEEGGTNWFILNESGNVFFLLIAAFGFILRDLGMLLLLSFSTRPRRASGAMLVYLLVLYILLPGLTQKLGFILLFWPDTNIDPPVLMILFPLVEAGIVLFLLRNRWKQISSAKAMA
jgi:hypothetical protein